MSKKKSAESDATKRLEISVERLYQYLNGEGLIDWKVKVSHPAHHNIAPDTTKTHEVVTLAAVDIDLLILRLISKRERVEKKERHKAKKNKARRD